MSQRSQDGFVHRRGLSRLAALGGTAIILSSLLMTVGVTAVTAADTGAKLPTTTGAPSNGWTNPTNALTDNGAYATARPANNASTGLDQSYGTFDFGVPNGSIIDAIRVRLEANATDSTGCSLQVRLSGAGGSNPASKTISNVAGVDTLYTLGNLTSDTWGVVWDPTQLTNANFRVELRALDTGNGGDNCNDSDPQNNQATFAVDYLDVTITYRTISAHTNNPGLSSTVCDAANFNFIIDMSGSIGAQGNIPSNLPDMIAGINKFVTDFEVSGDGKYAATRFNANAATNLTGGYINAAPFQTIIGNLSNPSGLTPTGLGIANGENNDGSPGPGQQIMFVVTDGSPNVPNTHNDDLTIPDTWLTGANAAIAAANAARGQYVVKAFYVSEDGPPADPGDTNLPFSPAGDSAWAQAVMTEIGGGSFLAGDFGSFVLELFKAIHCEPDIRVLKSADNSPIPAGATAAYTIEVKNIGKGTANGVTLSDPLPAGVNWTEDNGECSITSNVLNCSFGVMAADAVEVIHVTGVTDAADCGTLPNTANVTATNEPGNVLGNNHDSTTITVQCGSITIVKDAVPNDAQDFAFTTTGTGLSGFSLDDDANGTLSDTKVFGKVAAGAYTITEGAVAGWQLTNLVCNDTNGSEDLDLRKATLNVSVGENITCTFTNTKLGSITVEKQTSPDGASGNFTFTGTAAGTIADNGTIVVNDLLPGTYTSTEADPAPPFDLGSITCDDGQSATPSTWNLGNRTATFKLDAGENVKCTFTNVKRGSINIIKDAQPNGPQDFAFTTNGSGLSPFSLDDDADGTLPSTKAFTNIVPGAYSVTESDVTGWELTGLVCDGTLGSTGVKAGSTANITLTPGGSVTCTYTNVQAGRIIVDKVTQPAGDQASFEFDPSYGPNFFLTDSQQPDSSGDLKPGTYSVAELSKAGWDPTGATCNDGSPVAAISLQAGETVTCTFTNVKRGHIIVDKVTDPAGDPQSFTFTPTYNGGQTFQLADATTPNDSGAIVPGTYSVSEGAVAGWNQTGASCSDGSPVDAISLGAGETVTCTFTNTKAGHILIDKVTLPGGDPESFDFDPSYGPDFSLTDASAPNDSGLLAPGTYSVAELAEAGWDPTGATCSDQSSVSAISLQAGETVTCTFTNTKRGHILVDKVTDPAGDAAVFEFDPSYGPDFTLTDTSDPNASGALVPGTYSVAELEKAGWDLTGTSCTDGSPVTAISLQPGETVTCTFTNTERGTIIVEKQTSPDGAAGSFTFTGTAAGAIGDNGTITVNDLVPGTYSSTENDPGPDFDLGAIVCDDGASATPSTASEATRTATFKLDPGETITCVFTNVQRGTITIIKDAVPDGPQDFAFSTTGSGLSSFSLDDDDDDALSNMKAFSSLLAGPYSVTETTVAGWDLTDIECTVAGGSTAVRNGATVNLALTSGGSITCVYVNQKPSISIVKRAGTAEDGAEFVTPPGPVTYHYLVTNTGPVTLSGIVVSDDNGTPGTTADDFTATCPKTTLLAGESMECTATVPVTSNRTNIGTVSGTSGGGTQVSDTDDAVVRIPGINIDKSANDDLVEPNQIVTYTILVEVVNGPVHDAVVTDELPAGQTYGPGSSTVDGAPSEPDVNGQVLTWHLGTLDDEDSPVTITYDVVINGNATTAPQTNVAELCVSELPDLCEDDDEDVTPQLPDILIVKTAGDAENDTVYETEPGNVTYTYVVTNSGPLPLEDVTVTDDNGTPDNTADDFEVDCPTDTLAAAGEEGDSMTCTATVPVTVDTTNVAVAHGSTPEGNPVEDDDDAIVEVLVHGLVIAKSNDAPLKTIVLPPGTPGCPPAPATCSVELPTKDEGGIVTYTLKYTFSGDPVSNGIITDVLPDGVTYVADPGASSDGQFIFQPPFDAATRTLTWKAATVSHSGELTYQVKINVGAAALEQPLENTATIKSDQTPEDHDISDVYVPVIPKEETAPPTDIVADPAGPSAPGSSLLLVLAVLGGLVLAVGFVTPVPERVRRRYRR